MTGNNFFTLKLRLFSQEFQTQTCFHARGRQEEILRPTSLKYRQHMIWAFTNRSLQLTLSQRTVWEATMRDFLALALMTYLVEEEIICGAKWLTNISGYAQPDFSSATHQLRLRTSTSPQFPKQSSGDNSSVLPQRIAWRSELCKEWKVCWT